MIVCDKDTIRRILESDIKRRGNIEEEHFKDTFELKKRITEKKKEWKNLNFSKRKGEVSSELYEEFKENILENLKVLHELKNKLVEEKCEDISQKINFEKISPKIKKLDHTIREKSIFVIDESSINRTAEFFFLKIVEQTLKSTFRIKFSNRDKIVSALIPSLEDGSPKYIIRTDIKKFYENIDNRKLIKILDEKESLPESTKAFCKKVLHQYRKIENVDKGLPRGLSLSATLSEIFMKEIDQEISEMEDVYFYERYVDDIIIILKNSNHIEIDYIKSWENISSILAKNKLPINYEKTQKPIYIDRGRKSGTLSYLGYRFSLNHKNLKLKIDMADKKIEKIKKSIDNIFYMYRKNRKSGLKKKSERFLVNQVRYLTTNTRLHNRKSNAFVGIYFGNKFINTSESLEYLDQYLVSKIDLYATPYVRNGLKRFSFSNGFNNKVFINYRPSDLADIAGSFKK